MHPCPAYTTQPSVKNTPPGTGTAAALPAGGDTGGMATRLTLHMLGGQDLQVVFADDAEAAGVIEQIDNAQQAGGGRGGARGAARGQ